MTLKSAPNRLLRPFGLRVTRIPKQDTNAYAEARRITNGRVLSGPFSGMTIPDHAFWLGPAELLGCYEEELHSTLSAIGAANPARIVNIGCASGYYAVGLARLAAGAEVLAIDIDARAQSATHETAMANGVAERVHVGGPELLDTAAEPVTDGAVWVVDCEGAEIEYLNLERFPSLRSASVLVECHDALGMIVTPTLVSRFEETHDIETIEQAGRNPSSITELRSLSDQMKWSMISEHRPATMHWLWMEPKTR